MYESDRWIPRGRKDQKQQSNMMNTFERFMRKAVKSMPCLFIYSLRTIFYSSIQQYAVTTSLESVICGELRYM